MFKRKGILAVLAVLMLTLLTACGGGKKEEASKEATKETAATPATAEGWKWERNIEIICPWGTGGGADTTLRTFAKALEEELKASGQKVSVVVNNRAGAGGVSGVQFAMSQPADGYTYLMCTPSPLLAQISGATTYDVYGSIQPLCQMVHDCNMIVTGKDSPFNNYKEMMEFVEKNPGKVKAGVMTVTGLDAACIQAAFGDKIEVVAYTEGSQLNADVIGGHVYLAVVGPAEVAAMVESGDMKPVMTFTEKRLTLKGFDNVECAGELGIDSFFGPARGIFYKSGTPEEAIKAFEVAAEKAIASELFQKWAVQEGLDQRQGWLNREAFKAQWDEDYKDLTELFGKK